MAMIKTELFQTVASSQRCQNIDVSEHCAPFAWKVGGCDRGKDDQSGFVPRPWYTLPLSSGIPVWRRMLQDLNLVPLNARLVRVGKIARDYEVYPKWQVTLLKML